MKGKEVEGNGFDMTLFQNSLPGTEEKYKISWPR
jgi:hypothetical protein